MNLYLMDKSKNKLLSEQQQNPLSQLTTIDEPDTSDTLRCVRCGEILANGSDPDPYVLLRVETHDCTDTSNDIAF